MSEVTRRGAFKLVAAAGVAAAVPSTAAAEGFLEGTWIVQCEKGHCDKVTALTRNHTCESKGCGRQSVNGGAARVVCPNGHTSLVSGITRSHKCPECGKECRR